MVNDVEITVHRGEIMVLTRTFRTVYKYFSLKIDLVLKKY